MAEQRTLEATPFPPYFDRFIEERDVSSQCCGADFPVCRLDRLESLPHTPLPQLIEKIQRDRRLIAELGRLETRIQHNTERIDELRQEMERRIVELREEMERRFAEARDDRQTIRTEISRLDAKMDSYFRWTIGLMVPIVLGVLAITIRVFLLGPIP